MSNQDNHKNGSLVPVGVRDLAPVAAANPLVARGLADIAQGRWTIKRMAGSLFDLQNAIAHYFRGVAWYKESECSKASKEFDEAIRLFNEAIRLDPNNAFAYRHRGKTYWWRSIADDESYDKVMKDFDEAIRLDPNNAIAYVERGEARFWGLDSFEKGMEDLNEAIRLDPNNAGWYGLRGLAWNDQRDYDKAIRDFCNAIRLNANNQPDVLIVFTTMEGQNNLYEDYNGGDPISNPILSGCVCINLYKNLASTYRRRGRDWAFKFQGGDEYERAMRDFDEAIHLEPKNPVAYCDRGFAWTLKPDYDRAITDYGEAIRHDPKHAAAYRDRGTAWYFKQDYDRAIKDYDEAIRLDPKHASYYCWRGNAWSAKKDYDLAIKDYNEAIRLYPTHASAFERASAYGHRGDAWLAEKDYDLAIKDYNEAIRLDPKHAFYCRQLAWLLATCAEEKVRDGKRAIQVATNACELTEWKRSLELATLAAAYAETGQFDCAERYQKKALEDPAYRGPAGNGFRQRLELYKQKRPFRQNS